MIQRNKIYQAVYKPIIIVPIGFNTAFTDFKGALKKN